MKVFITGGNGKLGKELVKAFPDSLHPAHEELDILDRSAVYRFIEKNAPNVIIHCAAIANVRRCEEDKELAWKVNVEGTENLVRALSKHRSNCYFVYVSTACVFYGDRGNYTENDVPYPKNFYSLTKLLGEFVVKYSKLTKWLIIRTNFVAREKWPYSEAFIDRGGTYLFADDLALAIKSVLRDDITGLVHVCGEEKLSMFEVAKMTTPGVKPITLAEYNGPPVTADMSLKSIRIKPFRMTKTAQTSA